MPRNVTRRRASRRGRSSRRSYGPFNTSKFTPQSAYSMAVQAAKDIWYIKGLVNSEMLHNQSLGATTIPSTGVMTLLNGMAQNDTSSGRTGNSILMRNCHLRLGFEQNAAAILTTYRIILLWDTQQVGDTNPSVTDVLETASPYSPLATASAGRFKVLKSWFFTTDDNKAQTKLITHYADFRTHTRYNGTANTDIQKNGLYLLAIADQAVNVPTYKYSWKVGYHDN